MIKFITLGSPQFSQDERHRSNHTINITAYNKCHRSRESCDKPLRGQIAQNQKGTTSLQRSYSDALDLHIRKVDLFMICMFYTYVTKIEQSFVVQITVNPTINRKPFCNLFSQSISYSFFLAQKFPISLSLRSYLITKFLSCLPPSSHLWAESSEGTALE